jgi:hypothetical protein
VKVGNTEENWPVKLACDSDFHVNHMVVYVPQICNTDGRFTSPLNGGMLWGLFHINLTASPGLKLAILGTRVQHANRSR